MDFPRVIDKHCVCSLLSNYSTDDSLIETITLMHLRNATRDLPVEERRKILWNCSKDNFVGIKHNDKGLSFSQMKCFHRLPAMVNHWIGL